MVPMAVILVIRVVVTIFVTAASVQRTHHYRELLTSGPVRLGVRA